MSDWKQTYVKGNKGPCIELRKSFKFSTWEPGQPHRPTDVNFFAQALVVVRPDDNPQAIPEVVMSMNGKCPMTMDDLTGLIKAVGKARAALQKDNPYIESLSIKTKRAYNPDYGDSRECQCGDPYYRHFDSYEDMYPCGCKYCECFTFKEKKE